LLRGADQAAADGAAPWFGGQALAFDFSLKPGDLRAERRSLCTARSLLLGWQQQARAAPHAIQHTRRAGQRLGQCIGKADGLIQPGEELIRRDGDPALVKALARGFRWRRMLEEGRYASISEMAKAEGVERGYVGSLLRLTLLPPPMVEAILYGRQPEGVTLPGLLEGVPVGWRERGPAQPLSRKHWQATSD
jgi:hypothetical protein